MKSRTINLVYLLPLFLSTQSFADSVSRCLQNATNEALIDEITLRLRFGSNGANLPKPELQVFANCAANGLTIRVYNPETDKHNTTLLPGFSEELSGTKYCSSYSTQINSKAEKLKNGGAVAACAKYYDRNYQYTLYTIQITRQGEIISDASAASDLNSCLNSANEINSKP